MTEPKVERLPYIPPAPARNDRPIREGRAPKHPGADDQARGLRGSR